MSKCKHGIPLPRGYFADVNCRLYKGIVCKDCDGSGVVFDDGDDVNGASETCPTCKGEGRVDKKK